MSDLTTRLQEINKKMAEEKQAAAALGNMRIGGIGNSYGALTVKIEDGKYYWGIEDYDGDYGWEEITESLYNELVKFETGETK